MLDGSNAKHELVLVVDDEPLLVDFLRTGLEYEGYEVKTVGDGSSALNAMRMLRPDIVILDRMLPELEGAEVCRRMREAGIDVPVLMLTARGEIDDRVSGLEAGADDYLVKPFAFKELRARLRALLRRHHVGPEELLRVGLITLDPSAREVFVGDREMALTPREFDLLELFLRNPRRVLSRTTILDHVWGYDFDGDTNLVDVYVGYLRRKLGEEAGTLLRTVRGVGYALRTAE
ncbi:MAG: response regulator transcription factor [Chloroflexi bacterium]|nr:response regulator transcription factor [Chloroflexota bacterium]